MSMHEATRDQHSHTAFVVAHRAGNDLGRLRIAETLRIPLVEADVHLFAGRLEVRHLKTVGPVPLLWDRWEVRSPWTERLALDALLAAAAPGTELMLDLKGHDLRLATRVAAVVASVPGRLTVCSQEWRLLERFHELPHVRVIHSVGNSRQLGRLRTSFAGRRLDGVSIHRRLLDAGTVGDLRTRAATVLSWPVESVDEARTLASWGVDGLISSSFERLVPALAAGPQRVAA